MKYTIFNIETKKSVTSFEDEKSAQEYVNQSDAKLAIVPTFEVWEQFLINETRRFKSVEKALDDARREHDTVVKSLATKQKMLKEKVAHLTFSLDNSKEVLDEMLSLHWDEITDDFKEKYLI